MTPTAVAPTQASDAANESLKRHLETTIEGEVRFDTAARTLWSTDASPYEVEPLGVVLPKTQADVIATLKACARHGVSVVPRGGGTSLAGQTVGRGVVIDVSKHLNGVLDLNLDAQTIKVEPGVVRDELNRLLAPHKLQFTPDVSTTNRANVGGMVANNSAGTRSIKYGKSVDQVERMTVALSDGSVVELGPLTPEELHAKQQQTDLEGDIYRQVATTVSRLEPLVRERFPKVMRRVGGYNLDELLPEHPFNLAKLVSGSEGTLAFILDVTLKLHPVPERRMLAMLHFRTLKSALQSVPHINQHGPSAVELFDRRLFELGRENSKLAPMLDWLDGLPDAVLMVEFDGANDDDVRAAFNAMRADPVIAEAAYHVHEAWSDEAQARILDFRKAGLGIYNTVEGEAKPVPIIEDAAIPPEHLAEYIPAVQALCRDEGIDSVFYGHASVGVIHTRPIVDLKTQAGVDAFHRIADGTFELVKKYGGSWSGEHGDGLIRSHWNQRMFGDELYEGFRAIKAAFDPEGRMNPGKIVDAQPPTENLRYGDGYPDVPVDTTFDFSSQGGLLGAVEACTGVGACRKVDVGTMCPSYMATRDEEHSTRGRANLLRDALNGRMDGGLTSQEVHDALDLCLECKACKAECPSKVDMAKVKYEFLQQYYDAHGTPLSARAIGNVANLAPLAQRFAPLANAVLPLKPVRWLNERLIGVDARRTLPAYAREHFGRWFRRHEAPAREAPLGEVALFADTWTMYNDTSPGKAAVAVLEHLGYHVTLVTYGCCGRPQISKGLLREARKTALQAVANLMPYVERGVPVVGLEPSCVSAFQDDYRDLIPGPDTERVAAHVRSIEQFLSKAWTQGDFDPDVAFERSNTPLMLHGHCQQKAVMGTAASKALLEWVSSDVRELDAGCCGMAGSFGYGHHDVSMAIGERRLFPAVREHDGETAAPGFSCRHQIKDGTGQEVPHVIELLARAIKPAAQA